MDPVNRLRAKKMNSEKEFNYDEDRERGPTNKILTFSIYKLHFRCQNEMNNVSYTQRQNK